MLKSVIEIAQFNTKKGVSLEAFVKSATKLEGWLRKQPGFIWRRLCQGNDGLWIDCVEWQDEATAKSASNQFVSAPEAAGFEAMIDPNTMVMHHGVIVLSQ